MKQKQITRRQLLGQFGGVAGIALMPMAAATRTANPSFSYCLNTSTIMGQELGLVKEIEIAADAGYDGIEIWIRSLNQYIESGGSLADLRKRIEDLGIKVENAIGFAKWIVDDNDLRMQALEQAKQEMEMLATIGCRRIAAPPAGATDVAGLDLTIAAERFRALVELGTRTTVMPQLEVWGFSKNLSKLSEVLYVAAACGHPGVRILPDIYHLFKGGSDFDSLKLLNGTAIEIFHMNDYPATPGQTDMQDKDRVYPGNGVGPVQEVLQDLHRAGGHQVLSLELFNREYWKQDALEVAKTGLAKMKTAVRSAMQ